MRIEQFIKNLNDGFQKEFGEKLIHNEKEALMMGEFILDVMCGMYNKTPEDYGYVRQF